MERYVESKLDYKSNEETIKAKKKQCGYDMEQVLRRLEGSSKKEVEQGKQVKLLEQIFAEQYEIEEGQLRPVKEHEAFISSF